MWQPTRACEPSLVGALHRAHRGRGQRMGKEAAMAAPLFTCHSTMVLHFYGAPCFCNEHFWLRSSSFPSLQAVSSQPTAVLFPGLLSKPHVPAPSPHAHQWTHVSGWGVQGCGTDYLCRCHSVLPATDLLLRSPLSPRSSPSVPADLLLVRGLPWMQEPLLSFTSPPPGAQVPSCFLLSFFSFLSSYPVTWRSFLSF